MSSDFALELFKQIESASKREDPDKVLAIQCEVAGAAYILATGNVSQATVKQRLESLRQTDMVAYLLAMGVFAHFTEQGIGLSNIKEYMENRVNEFVNAARR